MWNFLIIFRKSNADFLNLNISLSTNFNFYGQVKSYNIVIDLILNLLH